MAETEYFDIVARVKGKEQVDEMKKSIEDAGEATKATNKDMVDWDDTMDESSKTVKNLDKVTGGLASQFVKVTNTIAKTVSGLKILRTAMIASVAGAVLVALAAVVAYWDDITNFVKGTNDELERNIQLSQRQLSNSEHALALLEAQEDTLLAQGMTQEEINNLKIQELRILEDIQKQELEMQKQRLADLVAIRTGATKGLEGFFRISQSILLNFAETIDEMLAKIGFETDFAKNIAGASNSVIDGIFGTADDIKETEKRIRELELAIAGTGSAVARLNEENRKLRGRGDQATVIEEGLEASGAIEDDAGLRALQERADAEIAITAYTTEQIGILQQAAADSEIERQKMLANQILAINADTFGKLAEVMGENTKAGKIAAAAQALINAYLGVTAIWANPTVLPEPFGTINKVASTALALTSALKAVQAINDVDTAGLPGSGGGGRGASSAGISAPSFNLVQGTAENQIVEGIQQQNEPVKAFVVSREVTSAQSLDRNIENEASLG